MNNLEDKIKEVKSELDKMPHKIKSTQIVLRICVLIGFVVLFILLSYGTASYVHYTHSTCSDERIEEIIERIRYIEDIINKD